LVTVPSNSLRNQLFEKFETFGLLKKFGVIGEKSLYPIVGIVNEKFKSRHRESKLQPPSLYRSASTNSAMACFLPYVACIILSY
jgi:hypothetical protein